MSSILIAFRGILGKRLHDEIAQHGMKLWIHVHRGHRSALENALPQRFGILAIECLTIGHHLVEHCAQTEEVRAGIDILTANLLRGHVLQDQRDTGHLSGKLAHAGDAESQNSYGSVPPAHDLGGLQTIVKYVVGVGVIEAAAHLPSDIEQVPNGKPFFARQHGGNAVALDIFHGGTELAFDFSRAGNRREVGVAQDLGGLCLFEETLLQLGGLLAEGRQLNRFQGDGLAGFGIVGLVDRASGRL